MADHAYDPQAAAFRNPERGALVDDAQIAAMLASGALTDTTDHPIVPVEDHEDIGWDAERTGPKTVQEAREALAGRVADPAAPDTDATLYDDL